ncbi:MULTISPECIES: chromate efflux transporter [unclassified Lysinibacillus]|uniref:chromate efflux transporter n=1 Tax=unclassified Lysinibacillus TaxID=2636778 RepID=UPI003802DE3B
MPKLLEIFLASFKLGCTSFGGPTAHLGFFQNEYVQKRKWLTDKEYSNLVALSQFLPGPASSQVGMGIGLLRGGLLGSLVSFLGFTLPSVLLLMLFAYFYMHTRMDMDWIHGLKLVAVAIVAQAIWDMSKKLIPSILHLILAILSLITGLLWGNPFAQIIIIVLAGLTGSLLFKQTKINADSSNKAVPISKATGGFLLVLYVILLIALPIATALLKYEWLMILEKCYLAGALVFGGGHVVLPLLETQFVQSGLMSSADFIAGYGLAQAVPGPLFTFASYIGMVIAGVPGAAVATLGIFLPAFLLIVGAMPFWLSMSRHAALKGAMTGANAAVVGILASAFIHPIVTQTIQSGLDLLLAVIFLWLSIKRAWSPYLLVLMGIIVGLICY